MLFSKTWPASRRKVMELVFGNPRKKLQKLRDMLSELRSKFDENLFWMKKSFAKLSEGQGEGASGTGSGGA